MPDIELRLKKIVAKQLQIGETEIRNDAIFTEDLGADSVDTVEFIIALEKEFGCEIPDHEAEKITTITRAIAYIKEHKQSISLSEANMGIPTSKYSAE